MDALVVDKVRKTFEAENAPVRALRGANLVVPSGDFVALMGPSGCGKSTLLNLVAGLDVADEGTIMVAGEQVTGRSEDELSLLRRKHIGIVFQFFNLLEGMTVLENVCSVSGTRRRRFPGCSREVSARGWPSRGPWPTSPRFFWPTSRRVRSTPRAGKRSLSS
jgi:putative ABC transport system ATP-binding protein